MPKSPPNSLLHWKISVDLPDSFLSTFGRAWFGFRPNKTLPNEMHLLPMCVVVGDDDSSNPRYYRYSQVVLRYPELLKWVRERLKHIAGMTTERFRNNNTYAPWGVTWSVEWTPETHTLM